MKNSIIYLLTVEDIQNVANQELGRNLTSDEIEKIKDVIAEKIKWFDVIAEAINEKIDLDYTSS
ncbi:MAG: hypothetical protein DYG98_18980 [Haliscomenobacteraceae bacterium CHB4]|nr:hypothetical protein [Saprospiraceae bacterium]MCE7925143.1 hypothetical protein [Haliscomenobacteraceae bacterium CHB4]